MGINTTKLRKSIVPNRLKVLVLGLDGAGKSLAIRRMEKIWVYPETSKYPILGNEKPTIGCQRTKIWAYGTRFDVTEVGGHKNIRFLWPYYYEEAHAVVFVVDGTDTKRFNEVKVLLERVLSDEKLKDVPLLVLCNKQDGECVTGYDLESKLDIKSMPGIKGRDFCLQEASGATGFGLLRSLNWLAELNTTTPLSPLRALAPRPPASPKFKNKSLELLTAEIHAAGNASPQRRLSFAGEEGLELRRISIKKK